MSAASLPQTLGAPERAAVAMYVQFVRERFGPRVRALRLFGSRARGEGDEDSDVDVLVVVDELTSAERRDVWYHAGDVLTAHDVIIGGLVLSTASWGDMRARELRIVTEIERDGVTL
ncbi:MAG: nucleotidyltransferase domain-containing protein [Planctomycetes bacterium]|nr:nucleotidyltransferase domain-containing protein [Planctomycetota bacterium]